jgi:hypothetical protein
MTFRASLLQPGRMRVRIIHCAGGIYAAGIDVRLA